MKKEPKLDSRWKTYAAALCTAVVLYVILAHLNVLGKGIAALFSYVQPVILGLVIAYILNPFDKALYNSLFRKMRERREHLAWNLSTALTIVLFLVLIILLFVALIPQLIDSVTTLISNIGLYAKNISDFLDMVQEKAASFNIDINDIMNAGQGLLTSITEKLTNSSSGAGGVLNTVTNIGSGVMNAVISFIIAIYFLLDKKNMKGGLKHLVQLCLSDRQYPQVASFWSRCNRILIRFIVCELLDACIVGAANFVFMTIGRMPYSVLISVVVGVTNLAPTFGPIAGGAIGAFILVLDNPWNALGFLIFTVILQTVDGYVIKPKLYGGSLGIPGIWILISIIVCGRMWGVVGILIGIPLAAIIDFIYHDYILVQLQRAKKRRAGKAESSATAPAEEEKKA